MSDYRHGSHTTFSIHLPIVWITKYRHKVLRGEVAERVRAIVREECQKAGVDILQGHISSDHVHVMVSIPPHVTISRLVQRMKGKSSYRLLAEFPHLRKRFWQTPPDLVVKFQPVDIVDVILWLVLRPRVGYQWEIKG